MEVGGTKGHVKEPITGKLFRLYDAYDWRMIPNCTGRYTCRNHDTVSHLTPTQVLEGASIDCSSLKEYHFSLPGRNDEIRVIALDGDNNEGIISYVKESPPDDKSDNRYVHTLNTQSGFRRKLEAIGIIVTDSDIVYRYSQR